VVFTSACSPGPGEWNHRESGAAGRPTVSGPGPQGGDRSSHCGRKHLTQLGWAIGPMNPASALLQAYHIDTILLRSELDLML